VIRTESESPPPPLPLFEPKPKKGEQNEELWEEEGPKLKPIIIKTELPQKVESPKTKSTPEKREPVFKEVQGKYITKKIDIKPKPKSESVSTMARMGKAEVTAPMQRMSMQPAGHGVINLRENIGNIPQLQWAIIMMEVLSPPKSLRNE
ncbi:MAG: hypothetical protein LDL53_00215, partial [Candidatus Hydrogenedens sp.]|nr:hypothetical protein [Candidatus Hydrogenedens sp.]